MKYKFKNELFWKPFLTHKNQSNIEEKQWKVESNTSNTNENYNNDWERWSRSTSQPNCWYVNIKWKSRNLANNGKVIKN